MMEEIEHNVSKKQFILRLNGVVAVLQYQLSEKNNGATVVIDFSSTFVPPEFRGKGLAEKLVRAGIKWAKEQGYELQASCWYAEKFIR